jgi:hypothetical protein
LYYIYYIYISGIVSHRIKNSWVFRCRIYITD